MGWVGKNVQKEAKKCILGGILDKNAFFLDQIKNIKWAGGNKMLLRVFFGKTVK